MSTPRARLLARFVGRPASVLCLVGALAAWVAFDTFRAAPGHALDVPYCWLSRAYVPLSVVLVVLARRGERERAALARAIDSERRVLGEQHRGIAALARRLSRLRARLTRASRMPTHH